MWDRLQHPPHDPEREKASRKEGGKSRTKIYEKVLIITYDGSDSLVLHSVWKKILCNSSFTWFQLVSLICCRWDEKQDMSSVFISFFISEFFC